MNLMIKTLTLSTLFPVACGLLSPIHGQDTYLGARGGLSVVDYSLPNLSEDWRSGGVAGAFLILPVSDALSFQGEVSWVEKGATWFKEEWGPTRGLLDYAEAAALLRLSLPLGSALSVNGVGGPWAARLLDCSGDAPPGTNDCDTLFEGDVYRRTDYGWTLGVGLGLEMESWLATLDLRWSRGVVGVFEGRDTDNPQTRSTQLTLGLGRKLGGDE